MLPSTKRDDLLPNERQIFKDNKPDRATTSVVSTVGSGDFDREVKQVSIPTRHRSSNTKPVIETQKPHSLDLQQPQMALNTEKCAEGKILKFCNAINLVQPVERRPAHLQRKGAIKTLLKRSVLKSHLGGGGVLKLKG